MLNVTSRNFNGFVIVSSFLHIATGMSQFHQRNGFSQGCVKGPCKVQSTACATQMSVNINSVALRGYNSQNFGQKRWL